MTTPQKPPLARPAAAVLLVRDAGGHPEVFMGQRHEKAAFGSAFVFPGGALSDVDRNVWSSFCGLDPLDADRRLSVDDGALDFYSAAIRELLEETGVFFARTHVGAWMAPVDYRVIRERLIEDEGRWGELVTRHGLRLCADALHYIGHWEAPLNVRPRFSARFFVAQVPPGQDPEHDGKELVASRWFRPATALELQRAGAIKLAFPTIQNLRAIAQFDHFDGLMDWAKDRWREGVARIRPFMVEEGGERRFFLPSDPEYPEDMA